jgi:hypothetical protein
MPLKKIFLCHSSSDKIFVDRLAFDLEKVNVGVWYDKWEIRVGDSLIEKIQDGLESHDYLAIILSAESVISEWVKKELHSALIKEIAEKKIVVLPCLIQDCSIPPFLREKKYADFRKSYEDGFTDLLLAIFPESKENVIRSRDFRIVQYLIAGLVNTDSFGCNTLNAYHLTKIYPFRKELKSYLGQNEKRLLFNSAVAFKAANPDTPWFLNNNVPVWALINDIDDSLRSHWIVEGINQNIFHIMAQYFGWAIAANPDIDFETVMLSCLRALESFDPEYRRSRELFHAKSFILKLLAKNDPEWFIRDFLKEDNENPLAIEASVELPNKLGTDYYLRLYQNGKKIELIPYIIKSLAIIKKKEAIEILSRHYSVDSDKKWTYDLMNLFHDSVFIPSLREWLDKCSEIDDKIEIVGALGNCGDDITNDINGIISACINKQSFNYTLIRAIGCYGSQSHIDFLLNKFNSRKFNFIGEAIIYSFGRLMKSDALPSLKNWYKDEKSYLIKAASIETIARYDADFIDYEVSNHSQYKDNPYMLSALVRATKIAKSKQWKEFFPLLCNHPSILIKLCTAQSMCVLADQDYCENILDNNHDAIVKTVVDEYLYCREPFLPYWEKKPYNYNLDLARLPIRLTWPDQPIVYFQRKLDTDKILNLFMTEQEY